MPDDFKTLGWDEDRLINSATLSPAGTVVALTGVNVTLRDQALRCVLGISKLAATGFVTPSSAPYAYWKFGPSRLGLSNATESYLLEFNAEDTTGFLFASIIGVKVKQAGG